LAREAVTYATNPEQINTALFDGKYTTGIESPWTPQSWAYPGKVSGYQTYNLAKAKALVKQLGGLSFTLTIRANDPISLSEAEALQSQWAQAGIKAQIALLENVALIQASDKGDYQAMLYRWAGGYDPDSNVFNFFLSGSTVNASEVNSTTIDALLFQERAATTQSARKTIFDQLAKQLAIIVPRDYLAAADWWRASVRTLHGIPKLANNYMELAGAWMG
jgi:peptide/nickel transport system substrate-binding protein